MQDHRDERAAGTSDRSGRNTGFQDALGVLVRMLQRGRVARDEIEAVIASNCRREGRPVPCGASMQRRVERLRCTFEQSGLVVESALLDGAGKVPGWRAGAVVWRS